MEGPERPAWFVGDLGDPWVAAIAGRVPSSFLRRSCPAELPEAWIGEGPPPGLVVLHRPILTALDAQRVGRLRARGEAACKTILCVGPHARHDDLGRWARLFDVVLPEATAAETIARHVGPARERPSSRPTVQVVSGLHDVRGMLVDLCRAAGYRAEAVADREEATPGGTIVWDVPMLDPRWPERLARRSRTGNVVALMGFADRETVATAREAGASACLEWPCELDDLAFVLDRVAGGTRADPGHVAPTGPAAGRRSEVAGPGVSAYDRPS